MAFLKIWENVFWFQTARNTRSESRKRKVGSTQRTAGLAIRSPSNGSRRTRGKAGGGRPAGLASGTVVPWSEPQSSPASSVFAMPCTKNQAEDTGRWRRMSRAHREWLFKPKRSRRGASRRRLCSQLGEICLELQQVLGLSYCGENGRRTRGVGARAL